MTTQDHKKQGRRTVVWSLFAMGLAISIAGIGKQALRELPQQFPQVPSAATTSANMYFFVAGLIFLGAIIGLVVGLVQLARK